LTSLQTSDRVLLYIPHIGCIGDFLKKTVVFLYLLLLSSAIYSQEDSIQETTHSLNLNINIHFTNVPLGIAIAYQRALNNYFNLEASFSFSSDNTVFNYTKIKMIPSRPEFITLQTIKQEYEYGIGAGLMYRPFGHRLKGWYVCLTQGLNVIIYDNVENTKIYLPTAIQSGYQWIFTHGITLSSGLGLAKLNKLSDNRVKIDNIEYTLVEDQNEFFKNYSLSIRLGVGYSW